MGLESVKARMRAPPSGVSASRIAVVWPVPQTMISLEAMPSCSQRAMTRARSVCDALT